MLWYFDGDIKYLKVLIDIEKLTLLKYLEGEYSMKCILLDMALAWFECLHVSCRLFHVPYFYMLCKKTDQLSIYSTTQYISMPNTARTHKMRSGTRWQVHKVTNIIDRQWWHGVTNIGRQGNDHVSSCLAIYVHV